MDLSRGFRFLKAGPALYSYNTDGVTGPRLRTPRPAGRKTKGELCEITLGCRNQKAGNKTGIIQEQKKINEYKQEDTGSKYIKHEEKTRNMDERVKVC